VEKTAIASNTDIRGKKQQNANLKTMEAMAKSLMGASP